MDGQSSQNELQLMSLDFGGNDYGVSQLAENHPYQNYFLEDGSDGFNYMSPPLPQWIRCQQNTPKYVEFLAENGVSELQVDISHSNISSMTCSFQHTVPFLDMNVKQAIHPRLHNESPINNFTGAQHQISVHTENSNDGHCNASQPHSSALPPKPHRKVLLRKRAYASDRLRRLRIAERLNALQELLPQSKEGDKATVLDDIINLLQEQIKVQSMEHAHNCLLPMGITSENVANRYGVTRQDQAAVDSHRKVAAVTASGKFKEEIVPVHTKIVDPKTGDEKLVTIFVDDGIRESTIVVDLTKLRPAFKKDGTTTVGNSSQVSDGAGAILLMKRSVAVQKGLPILSL